MEGFGRGSRAILVMAATIIVIGGLKVSGEFLPPILLAAFLAALAQPGVRFLTRRRVPGPVAIFMVVAFYALLLSSITGIVVESVRSFTQNISEYEEDFRRVTQQVVDLAHRWGFGAQLDPDSYNPSAVMPIIGQGLNSVLKLVSQSVIIVVAMTFMLIEGSELRTKIALAFDMRDDSPLLGVSEQIQRYLFIKTIASAITAAITGLSLAIVGLDFVSVWMLLTFLLNYIPTIGSIVAAIPPVLLALVTLGWGGALVVLITYVAANFLIGNLAEPRFLGHSLGLSPLIVFLSLLFWGWMWGPIGVLFSVPLTVILKLVLEGNPETEWIAVLLGSPRAVKERLEVTEVG